jgi:carbon-monoxide dehydrogenase catalytic subunit
LKATIEGKTPFKISEPEKLKIFTQCLELDISDSDKDIALRLYNFVKEDFNRPYHTPSEIVAKLAPLKDKNYGKN